MADVSKGLQNELDVAKRKLQARRETVNVIAVIAFVLALPGPLFILLSHIPFGGAGELNLILYSVGFQFGLVCNTLAMLWGVFALNRWKGIAAVAISSIWWIWFFGTHWYGN